MNNRIIGSLVLLTIGALATQTASAIDGNITFSGTVTAQTCDVSGNDTGDSDFEVQLPDVSVNSLAGNGTTAGATPFTIKLTNCTPGTGTVHTYFESGLMTNAESGNLKLAAAGAVDVEIGIYDEYDGKIMMGAADADQNSPSTAMVAGAASMNYVAKYVSMNDTVGAGAANTQVSYTIAYE